MVYADGVNAGLIDVPKPPALWLVAGGLIDMAGASWVCGGARCEARAKSRYPGGVSGSGRDFVPSRAGTRHTDTKIEAYRECEDGVWAGYRQAGSMRRAGEAPLGAVVTGSSQLTH